jgi:hypothetical protein
MRLWPKKPSASSWISFATKVPPRKFRTASNSGGLARLMGGGLMAVGTKLMALGLGMSQIQNVAREIFKFGRGKIGPQQMGAIIAGTPGLSQFV